MKYVPPLGATDPNASYQDGNPEAGILGSIVPAAAIERPQREILNVLTAAGLTPSDTDLTQLLAAIRKIIGTQNAELERLRLLKIGCPMYWRSTTLPEGFAWVNGDLIFFEDRPEFEEVYLAGGFEGMLLEANATSEQIAANLGKFRKHPNGLGLYLPSCGEQFFRAWTGGNRAAGSSVTDTTREVTGRFGGRYFETSALAIPNGVSGVFTKTTGEPSLQSPVLQGTQISEPYLSIAFSLSSALAGHTGSEIAPVHIWHPCIVYLGNSA